MKLRTVALCLSALAAAGAASAFVLLGNPPFRWASSALPRNIVINSAGHSSVADGSGGVARIVADLLAPESWNGAGAGTLITTTLNAAPPISLSDGISTMHFNVVGSGCSGGCLAVTLTPIPPSTPTQTVNGTTFVLMTDSDIFFNPGGKFYSEAEPDGCSREYHIESTAVHEVGHLLGLAHTPVPGATMLAFVDECDGTGSTLETDDVNGINCIYNDGFGCGSCTGTTLEVLSTECSIGTGGPNAGDFIVQAFIVDGCGLPQAGAFVHIDVNSPLGSLFCEAETDSNGRIACALDNPPDGNYTSTVTSVSKSGFTWPGTECDDADTPCACGLTIGDGAVCGNGLCEGDEATTCAQDCADEDDDGIADSHDNCPSVANAGQANADGDAAGDACDCAVSNGSVWRTPGEVQGLVATHDRLTGITTVQWAALTDTGALSIAYDTLRSTAPSTFNAASCLESAGADLQSADGTSIAPGVLLSYLVRGVNACPSLAGDGSIGTSSSGTPRTAPTCP